MCGGNIVESDNRDQVKSHIDDIFVERLSVMKIKSRNSGIIERKQFVNFKGHK